MPQGKGPTTVQRLSRVSPRVVWTAARARLTCGISLGPRFGDGLDDAGLLRAAQLEMPTHWHLGGLCRRAVEQPRRHGEAQRRARLLCYELHQLLRRLCIRRHPHREQDSKAVVEHHLAGPSYAHSLLKQRCGEVAQRARLVLACRGHHHLRLLADLHLAERRK
eukprot:3661639-Prymnesium_polylepis.1